MIFVSGTESVGKAFDQNGEFARVGGCFRF